MAALLSQVALELAGRAGMRLAAALGIAVHRSTLLRLLMDLPEAPATAPRTRSRSLTAGILWHNLADTPPGPSPATGPASSRSPQPLSRQNHLRIAAAAAAVPAGSRLAARMRDQHASSRPWRPTA